jgi:hypothetical protein
MEITYEQFREAGLTVKNYRIQEKKKFLSAKNESAKINPTLEELREVYSYRLYYQILMYFGKPPRYHRFEPSMRVSDLNNVSQSTLYKQKGFGKRLRWELDKLCKTYNITLGD